MGICTGKDCTCRGRANGDEGEDGVPGQSSMATGFTLMRT